MLKKLILILTMLLVVAPANAGVLPLISTGITLLDIPNDEIAYTANFRYLKNNPKGLIECEYTDGHGHTVWHMSFDNGYAPMCPATLYAYWGMSHAFVTDYSYRVWDNWRENTPEGRKYAYGRTMEESMKKSNSNYAFKPQGSSTHYVIDGDILRYMLNEMLAGKKPATMGDIMWHSKEFDPNIQSKPIIWDKPADDIIHFVMSGY